MIKKLSSSLIWPLVVIVISVSVTQWITLAADQYITKDELSLNYVSLERVKSQYINVATANDMMICINTLQSDIDHIRDTQELMHDMLLTLYRKEN